MRYKQERQTQRKKEKKISKDEFILYKPVVTQILVDIFQGQV